MKQCSFCSHMRADGNLWCQKRYCPAEDTVKRLRPGDIVGEMEVVKWVATLPAGIVYRVKRANELVLLKVAHPGFEEKLKREARFLQGHSHPGLPKLLPAHGETAVSSHPYGQITINNQILTYLILADIQGRIVQEWLTRNPQPWHQHVGWIISSLTDIVAYVHHSGMYHFALSPEIIMIRFDNEQIPRPTLLDLGLCASFEDIGRYWQPQIVRQKYLAPELQLRQSVGAQTDVYGLGLILRQMLTGSSENEPFLRADIRKLPQLARKSTSASMANRPKNILAFATELLASIPSVPKENKAKPLKNHLLRFATIVIMVIATISLLTLLLGS